MVSQLYTVVGKYCLFKKHRPCDFAHPHYTPDPNFESYRWTSWTAWGYSEHHYLLFCPVSFVLNINRVPTKTNKVWIKKSIGYHFLRLPAVPDSCFAVLRKQLYSYSCTDLILCGHSFESFIVMWAEDFDTSHWAASRCKDFLGLIHGPVSSICS